MILAKDLGYGETGVLAVRLENVSKLLEADAKAILSSGS